MKKSPINSRHNWFYDSVSFVIVFYMYCLYMRSLSVKHVLHGRWICGVIVCVYTCFEAKGKYLALIIIVYSSSLFSILHTISFDFMKRMYYVLSICLYLNTFPFSLSLSFSFSLMNKSHTNNVFRISTWNFNEFKLNFWTIYTKCVRR